MWVVLYPDLGSELGSTVPRLPRVATLTAILQVEYSQICITPLYQPCSQHSVMTQKNGLAYEWVSTALVALHVVSMLLLSTATTAGTAGSGMTAGACPTNSQTTPKHSGLSVILLVLQSIPLYPIS